MWDEKIVGAQSCQEKRGGRGGGEKERSQNMSGGSGGGGGGGDEEEGLHLLFSTSPLEGDGAGGCGVSHTAVPPIHSSTHTHRVSPPTLNHYSHDAFH